MRIHLRYLELKRASHQKVEHVAHEFRLGRATIASFRSVMGMVVIGMRVVIVVRILVVVCLIERSADHSMLVFGRPRVHVDVESGGRHLVAHRVFHAHGERMSIFKRRLGITGDVHHGDQLTPNPAHSHIVNFENSAD